MMKKIIKNIIAIVLLVGFTVLALGSMGSSPSSYSGGSSDGGGSSGLVTYSFVNMSSYTVTLYDSTGSCSISPNGSATARFNNSNVRINDVQYTPADRVVCVEASAFRSFIFRNR